MNDEPKQRWKIRPASGGSRLIVNASETLSHAIGDADDGERYELVSVWMTDAA